MYWEFSTNVHVILEYQLKNRLPIINWQRELHIRIVFRRHVVPLSVWKFVNNNKSPKRFTRISEVRGVPTLTIYPIIFFSLLFMNELLKQNNGFVDIKIVGILWNTIPLVVRPPPPPPVVRDPIVYYLQVLLNVTLSNNEQSYYVHRILLIFFVFSIRNDLYLTDTGREDRFIVDPFFFFFCLS